jgi:predicted AAA+ superfamily ATPase
MPHSRHRFATPWIHKLAKLWPAIGILGLRQVGKTTLLREQLTFSHYLTLDSDAVREEARDSAEVFLARRETPLILDEIQKEPKLFDAVKNQVDLRKRPGMYYLSGSSEFSSEMGIRESLTGRLGKLQLHPLCLAEALDKPFDPTRAEPFHGQKTRFSVQEFSRGMTLGGLPRPMFLRDADSRAMYWSSWIETTAYRDVARVFTARSGSTEARGRTKAYDPEITLQILSEIGRLLNEGELPTSELIQVRPRDRRKLPHYLSALQTVFVLRRVPCHENGTGRDVWLPTDSGLSAAITGSGPEASSALNLARIYLMNEILCVNAYQGKKPRLRYFKSAKGKPVDWVWENVPIKVIAASDPKNFSFESRALEGAMKKLGSKRALLVAPIDVPILHKTGVSVVPWGYWS